MDTLTTLTPFLNLGGGVIISLFLIRELFVYLKKKKNGNNNIIDYKLSEKFGILETKFTDFEKRFERFEIRIENHIKTLYLKIDKLFERR
uniref:Uncharacterized protein n=1 Tax=viral metagenome TaxID=1070528 RepID=A0A6H1ZLA4_9ZZZZ